MRRLPSGFFFMARDLLARQRRLRRRSPTSDARIVDDHRRRSRESTILALLRRGRDSSADRPRTWRRRTDWRAVPCWPRTGRRRSDGSGSKQPTMTSVVEQFAYRTRTPRLPRLIRWRRSYPLDAGHRASSADTAIAGKFRRSSACRARYVYQCGLSLHCSLIHSGVPYLIVDGGRWRGRVASRRGCGGRKSATMP